MAKDTANDHDMGRATKCAANARTARPGAYNGGSPPPGPKSVGWKLNGVPAPKLGGKA
jgi:hypothetical protein